MILCITNYRESDILCLNCEIQKFLKSFENCQVYIYHDEDYSICRDKYLESPNIHILTENMNKGTLYGRIKIINSIPSEFDNEFLLWLDSDDTLTNISFLKKVDTNFKNFDVIAEGDLSVKAIWTKIVKLKVFKQIISTIKQYHGLKVRTSECNILTAGILDLCYTKNIPYLICETTWVEYKGFHQPFNILKPNFDCGDFEKTKYLLQDLIQWVIWEEKEQPSFNINMGNCNHVYEENKESFKKLRQIKEYINLINSYVDEISIDMPTDYKDIINKNFKI